DFNLSPEDAERLIMRARVAAGWIEPEPEPEETFEEGDEAAAEAEEGGHLRRRRNPSPSHRCAMGPSLSLWERCSAPLYLSHREREGPAPARAWEGEGFRSSTR